MAGGFKLPTPRLINIAARDYWLRLASRYLVTHSADLALVARATHQAAHKFRNRYLARRSLGIEAYDTDLEKLLFLAHLTGVPMPGVKQFGNIIALETI